MNILACCPARVLSDGIAEQRRDRGGHHDRNLSHAGLLPISTRAVPQDRGFIGAVVTAPDKSLAEPGIELAGRVRFVEP